MQPCEGGLREGEVKDKTNNIVAKLCRWKRDCEKSHPGSAVITNRAKECRGSRDDWEPLKSFKKLLFLIPSLFRLPFTASILAKECNAFACPSLLLSTYPIHPG